MTDLEIVQVILPAISPVYGNNPGYGILEIDDDTYKINELTFSFFQLEDYYRMGATVWRNLNLEKEYNFDLNVPQTIRDFNQK